MRNLCSNFISRKSQSMENRRVILPSLSLGIRKKTPMKRTHDNKNKNKKNTDDDLLMNKVVSYLKSNYYMFQPLFSPQPICPPPKESPGDEEEVGVAIEGNSSKLIDKVVDYLKVDCYMYSPLLTAGPIHPKSDTPPPSTAHVQSLEGSRTEEAGGDEPEHREREGKARKDRISGGRPQVRTSVVMRTTTYREAVKHMVHPNCRPPSVQETREYLYPSGRILDSKREGWRRLVQRS